MKPFFSIILAIYNVEDYLREALDSIKAQTFTDYEVICVNDGSLDSCGDILEEYEGQDASFHIITTENRGPGAARNTGIQAASGHYIIIVDPDDKIRADMLERLHDFIQEEPEIDAVFYNTEVFCGQEINEEQLAGMQAYYRRVASYQDTATGQEYFRDLMKNNEFRYSSWLLAMRRDFLLEQKISYEEGFVHEDVIFVLSVFLKAKKMRYLPEELYIYRLRGKSITNDMDLAGQINRIRGLAMVYYRVNQLLFDERNREVYFDIDEVRKNFDNEILWRWNLIGEPVHLEDPILDDMIGKALRSAISSSE